MVTRRLSFSCLGSLPDLSGYSRAILECNRCLGFLFRVPARNSASFAESLVPNPRTSPIGLKNLPYICEAPHFCGWGFQVIGAPSGVMVLRFSVCTRLPLGTRCSSPHTDSLKLWHPESNERPPSHPSDQRRA